MCHVSYRHLCELVRSNDRKKVFEPIDNSMICIKYMNFFSICEVNYHMHAYTRGIYWLRAIMIQKQN